MTFDYGAPAELFMAKRKGGSRQPLGYRRFATAAEAIRFAIEDFPTMRTLGAWMQVGDERFDGDAIQRLYDSSELSPATATADRRLTPHAGLTLRRPLTYIAAATSFRPALLRSRVRVLSLAPQNSDDYPTHDVRVIGFAERTNARRP